MLSMSSRLHLGNIYSPGAQKKIGHVICYTTCKFWKHNLLDSKEQCISISISHLIHVKSQSVIPDQSKMIPALSSPEPEMFQIFDLPMKHAFGLLEQNKPKIAWISYYLACVQEEAGSPHWSWLELASSLHVYTPVKFIWNALKMTYTCYFTTLHLPG